MQAESSRGRLVPEAIRSAAAGSVLVTPAAGTLLLLDDS